jgi:hypothetical protein
MPRHPPCALTHLHTKNTRQKTSYKSQQFARCSQPLSNTQTPHPTTKTSEAPHPKKGVWSQSPTVCWRHPGIDHSTPHRRLLVVHPTRRHYSTRVPHGSPPPIGDAFVVLLRKEVIQPHLPVRLPCYDFVPIADPTFDHSLPQGVRPWASGVTDFHDVTGGVYKARERIHRSVADLRLLATPTSRGRVADPDPN